MLNNISVNIIQVLGEAWWAIILLFLFFFLFSFGIKCWLNHIRHKFIDGIKWVTLEIKIPKENLRSPKAMEQVFANLHATYSFGFKFMYKWWRGRVEEWMSFEMVGHAHGIRFYAYVPEKYRNLVEAALFSQYPGAEIHVVDDYATAFGSDLPNDTYDLFGTDFMLNKEDAYPIKTYHFFEEAVEERRLDPIAAISEVMSGLKEDEMIWLQLLIRPTGDAWASKAKDLISAITERKKKSKPSIGGALIEFIRNFIWAPVEHPKWGSGGEDKPFGPVKILTPGEHEILEGIENKISKLGYETILRFIYLDKKNSFTASNVTAVMGAMRQLGTQNMNSLRPNIATITVAELTGRIRRKARLLRRKKELFKSYLKREMPLEPKRLFALNFKTSILSVEELATLYHPPLSSVGAERLVRLSMKKGGPPPDLPVIPQ